MLDEQSEVIRLTNAEELMYGNRDIEKKIPIDVRTRLTHYTIYTERKMHSDEAGQMITIKTSRRFIQPSISSWENVLTESYFKRYKLQVTVLHDPLEQARIEGVVIETGKAKTTTKLRELVGKAKTADEFKKVETKKGDTK